MNEIDPSPAEIAALAQKIWEEEGHPDGKAEEHWKRAEEQLKQWAATRNSPPGRQAES